MCTPAQSVPANSLPPTWVETAPITPLVGVGEVGLIWGKEGGG